MPLLCGEKSTTPLPFSLARRPLRASLPSLEGTWTPRRRQHRQSPICSHHPAHSADAEADSGFSAFCSPFIIPTALGSSKGCQGEHRPADAADGL